ncbi:MAG TPA: hypothetical protein VH396_03345 [Chitinophagaceae bacterium]
MVRSLRKRHLQIWIAWAVLIPIGIISAVIVRPESPKDKLLQPNATAALPVVLKYVDKDDYRINIRSNTDTSQLQLEWINRKILTYPTATIYEDTLNTNNISNATLIGRIETRGTYHFSLSKNLVRNNYHFIVYDFIHQKIIDSITF